MLKDITTMNSGVGTFFFCQAEDGIRDLTVTGVQTCALPIYRIRIEPAGFVNARANPWPEYRPISLAMLRPGGWPRTRRLSADFSISQKTNLVRPDRKSVV